MAMQKYLIVERGNVKARSRDGILHRTYYSGGDAVRADWEDYDKTVSVQLSNGRLLVISNGGVVLKRI
jgi:hypothetical protein